MENSSKALYIAASVLIAVLILSLVVLTFNKMQDTQTAREKINDEKNLAAINAEYEAFNKRLMYGADVISCLNKAISNNTDAERNNDPDLYIDVQVKLNREVEETFEILKNVNGKLKIIDTGEEAKEANDKLISALKTDPKLNGKILFDANKDAVFKVNPKNIISGGLKPSGDSKKIDELFRESKYEITNSVMNTGEFHLLTSIRGKKVIDNDSKLLKLVKMSEEYKFDFTVGPYTNSKGKLVTDKYTIRWTTAFKDFRKMAFTCKEVKYNDNTGRVEKMVFEENEKK